MHSHNYFAKFNAHQSFPLYVSTKKEVTVIKRLLHYTGSYDIHAIYATHIMYFTHAGIYTGVAQQ